jgi:hypothetical protein
MNMNTCARLLFHMVFLFSIMHYPKCITQIHIFQVKVKGKGTEEKALGKWALLLSILSSLTWFSVLACPLHNVKVR